MDQKKMSSIDHRRPKMGRQINFEAPLELQDQSRDRRYFTLLPNLIDDMNLSPYAVRIYLHIKRRAGESGVCFETCRSMAEACHMGINTVSRARIELEDAGLVKVAIRPGNHGHLSGYSKTVIDIWKRNIDNYATADLSPVGTGEENHLSLISEPPVPQECVTCPPGVIKEEPIKKNLREEEVAAAEDLQERMKKQEQSFFSLSDAEKIILSVTGFVTLPSGYIQHCECVLDLLQNFGYESTLLRLKDAYSAWTQKKRKGTGIPYSRVNPGWIDWAITNESIEQPVNKVSQFFQNW